MAGTHAGFPSQIKGGQHAQLRDACPQRIEQAARVAHQAAQPRQAGHCHSGVCRQLLAAEGQLVELRAAQQRLHRGQRQAALALELHPSQRPGLQQVQQVCQAPASRAAAGPHLVNPVCAAHCHRPHQVPDAGHHLMLLGKPCLQATRLQAGKGVSAEQA